MLVAALGFTPDSLQGTWPANYVVKAKSLGILDGIKAGPAGATRGDIAIMAFQTLDAKIGSTDKDGKWDANDPVDNMLKRLGAKEYNPDEKGEAQPFLVTKGIADDAIANLMPYIGAWITAYENSDGDIIAVKEVKSTFLKGKFDGGGTFKADGVEYSVSKDAKADLGLDGATASAIAFVNGDVKDEFFDSPSDLNHVNGKYTMAVDLSGKTIKEVYSVLEWDVNEHDLFSDGDADEISEDQKLLGVKFPLNDDEEIDLSAFELRGVDSLDDIKKDNVVYVYKNKENEIVRVEVGTEVVTGEITRKTSDDKYTVGGKTYEKADLLDLNFGFEAGAGDEVEFYLDYYGNIYRCDEVKGKADTYAVVLERENGTTGKLGKAGKLYLFLADGSDVVFEVDDNKVKPEEYTTGSVIKYGLNKDGVINDVKDVSNTTGAISETITAKGYFRGLAINTNAVIFTFNGAADKADPDNYSVTTLSKILDSENVTAYAYDVDKNKVAALLINSDVTGSDAVYGVVTDQAENNSDLEYEVTMLIDGKSGTYDTDKAEPEYKYDELYKVTFSPAGEAKLAAADPNATASAVVTTAGMTSSSIKKSSGRGSQFFTNCLLFFSVKWSQLEMVNLVNIRGLLCNYDVATGNPYVDSYRPAQFEHTL
jgi:hypothetical protein